MNAKYLKTLIALAALAALWGGAVYWNRRHSKAAATAETTHEEKVFPLKSKDVQSFTLTPRQGKAIECERENNAWEIVQPEKLSADSSNIDAFLSSLTDATVDEVVDSHPSNLKEYGLDPPSETIEVASTSDSKKFTLLLGDETPTSGGIYAEVGGSPRVVTLASYIKDSLEKSLFALRNKQPLTLNVDQVQKIEVSSKDKSYTLVINPEGSWDLLLPPAVRADKPTVDDMVSQLRTVSMQSVLAEDKKDLAKYGFNHPTLTLRVTGGGETQTLVLGKENGGNYDAMSTAATPVFTLGSDFLTAFLKSPADLRGKNLFSFSTFDVNRADVTTPKGHWVFVKKQDKWKQAAPATNKDEPTSKVEALLDQLSGLQAESFPAKNPTDLAAFGLTKPAYRFQVEYGTPNKTETVEVSKLSGHIYARRTTDSVPSEISKSAFDGIETALGKL